jgi:hypothetical protein
MYGKNLHARKERRSFNYACLSNEEKRSIKKNKWKMSKQKVKGLKIE